MLIRYKKMESGSNVYPRDNCRTNIAGILSYVVLMRKQRMSPRCGSKFQILVQFSNIFESIQGSSFSKAHASCLDQIVEEEGLQ